MTKLTVGSIITNIEYKGGDLTDKKEQIILATLELASENGLGSVSMANWRLPLSTRNICVRAQKKNPQCKR